MASKSDRERYIAENSEYSFNEDLFTFSLVDASTVDRLRRDGDIKLPPKKVNVPKDERWNTKQMSSKLMQGILQGDSIPKISESLLDVIHNNTASATRAARTLVTQAENHGRLDSYKTLDEQGVVQEKVWIATPDSRTRASHLDVDGERVGINDTFSNGLEYPADPSGEPEEVYNCRCSMRTEIVGFRRADGSISRVDYERDDTMHEGQMDEERGRRGIEKEEPKATPAPQISFTPAQTIEDAEEYARQNFVVDSKWAGEGTVSFKGMSIDNVNAINEELTMLFSQYDLPKFRNIGMMNFRQKIWKDAKDAPMAYRAAFNGELYFNPNILKSVKSINDYVKKGQESFDFCINNMDRFTGRNLEMVKRYKEAGRQTVAELSNNTIKAMLDHEFGHHIDHQIIMKSKEFAQITKDGMEEYGIKLSGYALHTRGEYVAESFCAYSNELLTIDPALKKVFDEVKK